jgi:hypothetical protein
MSVPSTLARKGIEDTELRGADSKSEPAQRLTFLRGEWER